jgi:hypothetical protein
MQSTLINKAMTKKSHNGLIPRVKRLILFQREGISYDELVNILSDDGYEDFNDIVQMIIKKYCYIGYIVEKNGKYYAPKNYSSRNAPWRNKT